MWFIEDDTLVSIEEKLGITRLHFTPRQSLEKAYWQNEYIDIVRPETIHRWSMTGTKILLFLTNNHLRDIDYYEDIPVVEKHFEDFISHGFINYEKSITDTNIFPS